MQNPCDICQKQECPERCWPHINYLYSINKHTIINAGNCLICGKKMTAEDGLYICRRCREIEAESKMET